jgi:hypothetical protein
VPMPMPVFIVFAFTCTLCWGVKVNEPYNGALKGGPHFICDAGGSIQEGIAGSGAVGGGAGAGTDARRRTTRRGLESMIVQLFTDVDTMELGPRFDECKVNLPQTSAYTSASHAAKETCPLTSDIPHPHSTIDVRWGGATVQAATA